VRVEARHEQGAEQLVVEVVQTMSAAGPAVMRPSNASRSGWIGTSLTANGRETHRQWRKFRIGPQAATCFDVPEAMDGADVMSSRFASVII
jgi:hypothetical protein